MKHFLTTTALATLATLITLSGCKPPDVAYNEVQTASIRILNFAPSCSVPLDIYWHPEDQPDGKQANIYYLQYGNAAVYTNGIGVSVGGTPYVIKVRPTNDQVKTWIEVHRTLQPGKKYTLAITLRDPNDLNSYDYNFFEDEVPDYGEKTNAFIRFFNEQPGVGKLVLKINDPGPNGQVVGSAEGEDFRELSAPYTAIETKQDTSYTLFLTRPHETIAVARLAYQTFVPGNHYTIVYSGDTCRIKNNADDTTGVDLLRLRNLDDNTAGNDLSNPIQPAFRYNIINVTSGAHISADDYIGFVVNGEGFPKYHGFSIPPAQVNAPAGSYTYFHDDTKVWDVYYQSGSIPQPLPADKKLPIRGSLTNANGSFNNPILRVNPDLLNISPDHSYSFVIVDTIPEVNPDSLPLMKSYVVPVPDEPVSDSVTVVFIQGVAPAKPYTTTKSYADFWVSQDGGVQDKPAIPVAGTNLAGPGKNSVLRFIPNVAINITTQIGAAADRVPGPSVSFTGEAGGIYEVVIYGRRIDAHVSVLHVNANNK